MTHFNYNLKKYILLSICIRFVWENIDIYKNIIIQYLESVCCSAEGIPIKTRHDVHVYIQQHNDKREKYKINLPALGFNKQT